MGPLLGPQIGPRTPQERHVDRFYPPGGSRGGSRRVSGRSFWGLFCGSVGGTGKKAPKVPKNTHFQAFFACVFLPLPCVFCSPRRSPARKQNIKICLKPLVFTIQSACAPFSLGKRTCVKQEESRINKCSNASKKQHSTEARKKAPQSTVLGAKMAPKIDPGGRGERLGGLLRATCAPRGFGKR